MKRDDWFFGEFFGGMGPRFRNWAGTCETGPGGGPRRGRRRQQIFESGEVKYVILRLLREQPRHGYDVIKALEERLGGWYTPSAGTVYPTLQLLEDQGYVRGEEMEGKKVYHITPEGEAFLDAHRDVVDDILERVRDAVRNVTGSAFGELNESVARLAKTAYRTAWRGGPDDARTRRVVEIIRQAADQIDHEFTRTDA